MPERPYFPEPRERPGPYREAAPAPKVAPPRVVSRPEPPREPKPPRATASVIAIPAEPARVPWPVWLVSRYPRVGGVLLAVIGVIEGASLYDFFFADGTIGAGLSSFLFHVTSPLFFLAGAWLAVCGVPRARPTWWQYGLGAAIGLGLLGSVWLGFTLHRTPTVVVDPRAQPAPVLRPVPPQP